MGLTTCCGFGRLVATRRLAAGLLEDDPQSELQLSGGGALGQLREHARLTIDCQRCIDSVGVDDQGVAPALGRIPILNVEDVKGFSTELDAHALARQRKGLADADEPNQSQDD